MSERAKPERARAPGTPVHSLFFPAFAVYVLVAPLYYASIDVIPLMLLELAAVGFLYFNLVVRRAPLELSRTLSAGLAILLVYPLIQLLPLPEAWWRALPGHAEYVAAVDRFAAGIFIRGSIVLRHTLSLVPWATEAGWLALLPPLACFVAAMRLRSEDAAKLLLFMSIFAGAQGLLGLLQVGAGGGSIFHFRVGETYGTAVGTFVNRNHYAALLAMT
ncbi:MAG: hypothetical protein ABI885_30760, partial [Gammaproteobacteria bacterium]